MEVRNNLNSTRSKLAYLKSKRVNPVLTGGSSGAYQSKYWSAPRRSWSGVTSASTVQAPQLFKVEMRPLSAMQPVIGPRVDLVKGRSEVFPGVKQILSTQNNEQKNAINRSQPVKLSQKVKVVYKSPAIRHKFVPQAPSLEIKQALVAQINLAAGQSVGQNQAQNLWPISEKPVDSSIQQTTVISNKRPFDIVEILTKKLKSIGSKNSEKKKAQNNSLPGIRKKNFKWLDGISTAVIALALVFSLAYLGPWLAFDVFKVGSGSGVSRVQSLDLNQEDGIDQTLNENAVDFLQKDMASLSLEEKVSDVATLTGMQEVKEKSVLELLKQPTLPPVDESLPEGEWLIISKIGLNGEIRSDEKVEEALAAGIVQVSGYGEVGINNGKPVILAAHRFGYKWWWKSNYARNNSFYYLPDLQVGDRVEIIKDQRKWTYEIFDSYEGTEIDNYRADLILYTCRYLNSDVRYFKYARLVTETL